MLSRLFRHRGRRALQRRCVAASSSDSNSVNATGGAIAPPSSHSHPAPQTDSTDGGSCQQRTFVFPEPFRTHRLNPADDAGPPAETIARRDEMWNYLRHMTVIRKMEMAADALYKAKLIRGFCHLSTGQEAVPVGIEAAIDRNDAVITAYRCHGFAYMRGRSVHAILAELLGKRTGCSKGKGGSMHMFAHNFYGGNGIVGAQVPLGVGIAFAQKYTKEPRIAVALYGDGAANQGQIFESFNIAALHRLPVVFVCENNFYGMGTSAERAAASTAYYTRGDYVPGVQVNGMDVLAVREAMAWAKRRALTGKGPVVLEMLTYRYHGHSMSDPGTTYRTRDEVQSMRSTKDTIKRIQQQLIEASWATEAELKQLDKQVKAEVDAAVEQAKADPPPDDSELWTDIYAGDHPNLERRPTVPSYLADNETP